MDRTELFDILLKNRVESEKRGFLDLRDYSEQKLNISDRALLESITDEMIERGWVKPSNSNKYSVSPTYEGIEMIEKYGSYSSFLRFENKRNKSGMWSNRLTTAKTIITIITTLGMFILGILKFNDNKKINTQKTEVNKLNKTIDSLKTELKKRTTTPYKKNAVDSAKTKG
jgi:hypothetical protein